MVVTLKELTWRKCQVSHRPYPVRLPIHHIIRTEDCSSRSECRLRFGRVPKFVQDSSTPPKYCRRLQASVSLHNLHRRRVPALVESAWLLLVTQSRHPSVRPSPINVHIRHHGDSRNFRGQYVYDKARCYLHVVLHSGLTAAGNQEEYSQLETSYSSLPVSGHSETI